MSAVALNQVIKDRYSDPNVPKPLKRFRSTVSSMGLDLDRLSGPGENVENTFRRAGTVQIATMAAVTEESPGLASVVKPTSAASVSSMCSSTISSRYYRYFMVIVIIFNSIWVGVDAEHNSDFNISGSVDGGSIFIVECVLCGIFAVDVLVRIFATFPSIGSFFYSKSSSIQWMNIFDLSITLLTVVDDWILGGANGDITFFIFVRAARLLRLVRLFVLIESLSFLARALGMALRSVTATFIILLTAIYIWAVVFTEWSEDSGIETDNKYFIDHYSTLFLSMLSMFELAIYDDAMFQVRTVLTESVLMGILLLVFIIVGGFLILNVLIGVIAEVVSEQSDIEHARELVGQMDEVFSFIDSDKNDRMSKAEFLKHGRRLLLKIGISDYVIEGIANIIDMSASSDDESNTHYISREEFIHFMTKMLSTPSSEDLLLINKKIINLINKYQNVCPK